MVNDSGFDLKEIGDNLQKFSNYSSAIDFIKSLPIKISEKRIIVSKFGKELENLKKDNTTYLKESFKALFTKSVKANKTLSFFFKKLSNSILKSLGHETASYFIYSDWLLSWTILTYFPIIFCFVCIPHIIYWSKNYLIVDDMVNDDQIVRNSYCLKSLVDFDRFNVSSLLQKSEFLNIIVYECFPGDEDRDFGYRLKYSLQNAYLLSLIVFFIIWILLIGSAVIKSISNWYIRKIRIQHLNIFSSTIFCSWPYYSNDGKFIKKKQIQLCNRLKLLKIGKKIQLKLMRVIAVNFLFLIVLGSSLYGLLQIKIFDLFNKIDEFVSQRRVILAAVMAIFNYFSPFICKLLSKIENSPKSFETKLNLIRMYFLQLVLFGLVISYVFINRNECWEDEFAKQIYFFILFDFLASILDIIITPFYLLFTRKEVIFNNSFYTANTTFSYFLMWVGLYFSPYLGLICIFSYFLIFLTRVIIVKKFYKPSSKSDNSVNIETYVIMITLLSISIGIVFLGTFCFSSKSSKTCGPFNQEILPKPYDYLIAFKNYMFEVKYIGLGIRLFLSPGFISFVIFLLCVITFSMIKIMITYKRTVKFLKAEIEDKRMEHKIKTIYSNKVNIKNRIKSKNVIMTNIEIEMETFNEERNNDSDDQDYF